MKEKKTFKSFDDFTNLYELSKTLRFELKPVGKTKELIEEKNQVLEKDKLIDDNYHNIKYYFDLLHRKFINEALFKIKLNLRNYYDAFRSLDKKDKKTQDNFRAEEEKLRKEIVKKLDQKADEWKKDYNDRFEKIAKIENRKPVQLKKAGLDILFEKDNLEILKIEFTEKLKDDPKAPFVKFIDPATKEEKNLFESFKGFTTYFTNFNYSRKNFYSEKNKDTSIANRIINENLTMFCGNKKLFDDRKKEYDKIGLTSEERKIFELGFYNSCLMQEGIDNYNTIIGRKTEKEGEKGLNQKINEYRQKTKEKLPFFKQLYNQILSKRDKNFREIEITNDDNVFKILKEFIEINDKKIKEAKKLFKKFISVAKEETLNDYDVEKIYLKKTAINTISRKFFGNNWQYFENALPHKETSSKEEKYKLNDFISIQEIKNALLGIQMDLPKKYKYLGKIEMASKDIFYEKYADLLIKDNYRTFLEILGSEFENCEKGYEKSKEVVEKMIKNDGIYNRKEVQNEKIKNYCDVSLAAYQMMKYFALEKGRKPVLDLEGDNNFYKDFNEYYQNYPIIIYYNEFRNYLTKKDFLGRLLFPAFDNENNREQKNPLSKRKTDGAEKIKLNFGCGYLLGGWAQSFDQYGALIFSDSNGYYLGIINENGIEKDEIKNLYLNISEVNICKRLIYDFQKPDNKNTPRLFIRSKKNKIAPAVKKLNLPIESIIKIYDNSLFKKNKNNIGAHKPYLIKLIDYFKIGFSKHPSYKNFNFKWKESENYKDISEFYRDVMDSCYKIEWEDINYESLLKLNEQNKIYLFKIYNKDFGKTKVDSKKNIHTSLFLNLLKPANSKVLRLMGGGEIFLRPKNEKMPIYQKNNKDLKFIDKRDDGKEKKVLQHRRYAEDKYFLHFPIGIIGRNLENYLINRKINEYLLKKIGKQGIKIIGIDRGEKNLAYYSVIDQNGKMIDGGSLNVIEMKDKNEKVVKKVDYLDLLRKKAGGRDEARKNWQTIENIKELKNGYVSQVVRKICDLILEHKAIIVFEDLNVGFKRSRSALDFPVYQKLELALVKKLNYLVNKDAKEGEAGHYLKAYQLAPIVANPQDIGKQTGIVFYTPAGYTSKTCPQCGFRKNNNKFYFETIEKAKKIIEKLKSFEYDSKKKRFKLEYCLSDFLNDEEKKKPQSRGENDLFPILKRKEEFSIYSDVIRYRWHDIKTERAKNERQGEEKIKNSETKRGLVKKYDITECIVGLFERNDINYRGTDLKTAITAKVLDKEFYKDLLHYLNLIFEIRNSISGTDIDYIQCPACGFHSSDKKKPQKIKLVDNGDANGAYNIARKGILILEKIKKFAKDNQGDLNKLGWKELAVNIEEWDKFVQGDK